MDEKLYILVRKDMHPSYQAVQAGHALAQYLLEFKNTSWNNGTLVYLSVDDEEKLYRWKYKLEKKDIEYAEFREPDIGNEITAIAAVSNGKVFKNLRLM